MKAKVATRRKTCRGTCRGACRGTGVFDLDDVAWGPQAEIARRLGIPYEKLDEFRIMQNTKIPEAKRRAILQMYEQAEMYAALEFLPEFSRITELGQKYNIKIQVNSNSCSAAVRDVKLQKLKEFVPDLPPERMRLGVVGESTITTKRFDDDTIFVVDDNPWYVRFSPAKLNIMPIHPWNQTAVAKELLAGLPVKFVEYGDFEAIYRAIGELFASL